MAVAILALFAALSGTVYAASRINGTTIRVKTLPGNRLRLGSVPANRLRPGVLDGTLRGVITGAQIDEHSLGQVPSAAYADTAGSAQSAVDAQTALNAVNAVDASTVNGHAVGCLPGTRPFAGACWQASASGAAATAPAAAAACATQGGTLPEALALAAFAAEEGVVLDSGDEWSNDIPVVSGPNVYAVVTVAANAEVSFSSTTIPHHFAA
jgi:hypothetical protein